MRDPDRTRQQLLEVARQQFADKGFAGARVDEIARTAGINKQAVYYHFESKENLFRKALEDGYRLFRERDRDLDVDSKPPAEALANLIGVTYDDLHHSPELIAMIMDENREKGRHLDRERVREINKPLIESINTILVRGERERVFRADIDPEQFYISMMSLLIGYFSIPYTLSASVDLDLMSDTAVHKRRAHNIDLLLRWVRC